MMGISGPKKTTLTPKPKPITKAALKAYYFLFLSLC